MNINADHKAVCIAILPFENPSGNADHEYFSIGFVGDLITDLSRFHGLQVISSYTSQKIDAAQPALGHHLSHAIRTGSFCAYAPENGHFWHL